MLAGWALTWLLREVPLRTSVHDHADAESAPAEVVGSAA